VRSRASLQLELLALRQQLAMVADRDRKLLRFRQSERLFWAWLFRQWPASLMTLMIFKPDTLVRWHRKGFRLYWTWKSRRGQGGRPPIDPDVRKLIRLMSRNNIGWGAFLHVLHALANPAAFWICSHTAYQTGTTVHGMPWSSR
jgi:putative transposase